MAPVDSHLVAHIADQLAAEGRPTVIDPRDSASVRRLPAQWATPLGAEEPERAVLAAVWEPVRALVPATVAALQRKLQAIVGLVTDTKPPSLLYTFSQGGEFFARRGYAPALALPALAARVPVDMASFYAVHDGFVNLYGDDGGPSPSAEWAIVGLDPDGSGGFLPLVQNGSTSLGYDLGERPAKACILWADGDVSAVEDFWAKADEWMAQSLADMDDRR